MSERLSCENGCLFCELLSNGSITGRGVQFLVPMGKQLLETGGLTTCALPPRVVFSFPGRDGVQLSCLICLLGRGYKFQTRVGNTREVPGEPGWHWKVPFVDQPPVSYFHVQDSPGGLEPDHPHTRAKGIHGDGLWVQERNTLSMFVEQVPTGVSASGWALSM